MPASQANTTRMNASTPQCSSEAASRRLGVLFMMSNVKMTGAHLRTEGEAGARPRRLTCYASEPRLPAATRMPKRQHLECVLCDTVVDEIANAAHVEATNLPRASAAVLAADARLLREKCDALLKVLGDGTGCAGPVLRPPLSRASNLRGCARRNLDAERHRYRGSSRSKSSTVTYSPRSISEIAASSSSSSSELSSKASSAPRASTATTAPSGRAMPSISILPFTTVPVATCIRQWYSVSRKPPTGVPLRHNVEVTGGQQAGESRPIGRPRRLPC
jgi:hypothetical protein